MHGRWHLVLALVSSLLFVSGALCIKRAGTLGAGIRWTNLVTNWATAVLFAPLWCLGGPGQPPSSWWQPVLGAGLLVGGQAVAFLAFHRGDVSVATPVLGIKTVLVAAFTTLVLAQQVSWRLWVAAALSSLAVGLLNWTESSGAARIGRTVGAALGAAGCFALFDVLVQKWAPSWGTGRLLPLLSLAAALLSWGWLPRFWTGEHAVPKAAWPWLLAGGGLMAVQNLVLITTLAVFGEATAVNIVYASRGLWSVVAVWAVGHWFANPEQHLGRRVLVWRLAGAVLMVLAIALVV